MTDAMDHTTPHQEAPTQVQPLSAEKRELLRASLKAAGIEQSGIALAEKVVDEIGVPLLTKILAGLG